MRPLLTRPNIYSLLYRDGRHAWMANGRWPIDSAYDQNDLDDALADYLDTMPADVKNTILNTTIRLMILRMATQWVASAMPVVELPDKVAAALCVSSVASDLGEFHAPWMSFAIEVPPGLIETTNEEGKQEGIHLLLVDYAVTTRDNGRQQAGWSFIGFGQSVELSQGGLTTAELFSDDPTTFPGQLFNTNLSMEQVDFRTLVLCRALVRGVILRCSDPQARAAYHRPLSQNPKSVAARRAKYGAVPDFDRYVMTDTVAIDARDVVRQFLLGERSSPSVRHLVRGHFRNQVCGAGRTERKRIWIHPHWRGEEGLPIATKNHVILSKEQ